MIKNARLRMIVVVLYKIRRGEINESRMNKINITIIKIALG